jgi:hypothetical protein
MRRFVLIAVAAVAIGGTLLWAQAPTKKAGVATSEPAKIAPASPQAARITMPPVPNPGYPPGRPVDQARAVYEFAAQHPEVLKYVPCYCGCESDGHPHNESCFVKSRDARGNVTEWDIHGYG